MKKMREKKMNNKGFSLVELIIVVAIMAVLIGVLAPTYMRYVERSRVGVDTQFADSIKTAMQTALLDPNITGRPNTAGEDFEAITDTTTDFWTEVATSTGVAVADFQENLVSTAAGTGNRLSYTYDATTGAVTVTFTHANGTVTVPVP